MIKKEYALGAEGRVKIAKVAAFIGDAVGKTMGPSGRNYFLPSGITNDGKTILGHLRFADPCEDQVALAFHEIARQQDEDAGDASSSAIVMGAKIAETLLPKISDIDVPTFDSMPVMELLRAIDKEKDEAIKILDTMVTPCDSLEELKKVAFTSMENREISDLVAEVMWKSGKDTFPVIKDGFNKKVETDVVKGIEFPLILATTSMFNQTGRAEYNDVPVFVTNHNFEQMLEISPLMVDMVSTKIPSPAIVIVAKQFSVPFVNQVSELNRAGKFKVLLVSGNFHNDTFEDIAAYVDARFIDTAPRTGIKVTEARFKDLGVTKTVVAREKCTQFVGGRGTDAIVSTNPEGFLTRVGKRCDEIKKEEFKDEKEKTQNERRVSSLLGGITTFFIDARTAAEKYYLKLKLEDTINSCRLALGSGRVVGGGVTFREIGDKLGENALLYPALYTVFEKVKRNNNGKEFDLSDVYDSYQSAKSVIENSTSVIKTVLTIEGIIADPEKDLTDDLAKKLNLC